MKIIDSFELSNFKENKDYILSCQDSVVGGFSKWPGISPDPFHTYFGVCGLSFLREPGLQEIMPSLNISSRAMRASKSCTMFGAYRNSCRKFKSASNRSNYRKSRQSVDLIPMLSLFTAAVLKNLIFFMNRKLKADNLPPRTEAKVTFVCNEIKKLKCFT